MNSSRWFPANSLWNQLQQLQQEMNHLATRWSGNGHRWFGAGDEYPPVNVLEDADQAQVEAELPGLDLKDLEIFVTGGNQLTLKGERKAQTPEKGVLHRQERGFGCFSRCLTLPFNVDADKVEAHLENGVLLIKLPKHASARPRKITVKGE
jgi:HSP20 family protein